MHMPRRIAERLGVLGIRPLGDASQANTDTLLAIGPTAVL